jgi:hypothetical protein
MCIIIQIELASSQDEAMREQSCLQRARDCLNRLRKLLTHPTNETSTEILSFTVFTSTKDFLQSFLVLELQIELLSMNWKSCFEILNGVDYSQISLDLLKFSAGNLFSLHNGFNSFFYLEQIAFTSLAPDNLVFKAAKITLDSIMSRDPETSAKAISPWFRLMIQSTYFENETECLKIVNEALTLIKSFHFLSEGDCAEEEIAWLMNKLWAVGTQYEE